jgi:hypothetical protein
VWSNDERALRKALEIALAGRTGERHNRALPMMRGVARMDSVLEQSGPTARRDVRREPPPMYLMAWLAGKLKRQRAA